MSDETFDNIVDTPQIDEVDPIIEPDEEPDETTDDKADTPVNVIIDNSKVEIPDTDNTANLIEQQNGRIDALENRIHELETNIAQPAPIAAVVNTTEPTDDEHSNEDHDDEPNHDDEPKDTPPQSSQIHPFFRTRKNR